MRDALGGTVTITIIVVFIVVVLAYLAFNVNYTKAFRMKNKIIATYEDYGGVCDGISSTGGSLNPIGCSKAIEDYAKDVGYETGSGFLNCPKGFTPAPGNYYCYDEVPVEKTKHGGIHEETGERKYYKIATRINIEIPIIQNIFAYQYFWVYGDTKTFTIK